MTKITDKDIKRFWSKVLLPDSNGCMLWRRGRGKSGYGHFSIKNKTVYAHRISLIISDGQPQNPNLEAIHSCRNKHCVAPSHLKWASHSENMEDKERDGTQFIPANIVKLSSLEISTIRRRYRDEGISQARLAEEYGVAQSYISRVTVGKFVL